MGIEVKGGRKSGYPRHREKEGKKEGVCFSKPYMFLIAPLLALDFLFWSSCTEDGIRHGTSASFLFHGGSPFAIISFLVFVSLALELCWATRFCYEDT